jgi:hypothetical protein
MTLIVVLIDGKWHCSFNGEVEQWINERFFKVVNAKPYTTNTKLGSPRYKVRTKQLRIFGNAYSELDMTLALFCYDMLDPTRQRIEKDMHHYQVEQYWKKTRH